jgi:hypothetical protein
MRIRIAALVLLASVLHAHAQTSAYYVLKDQSSPQQTLQMKTYTALNGISAPVSISSDAFGNPLSGVIGSTNPNGTALFVQGVTGGVPLLATINGTLPAFAATPTFNCGTGCYPTTQPVSGAFWPYTLGQQVVGSSVPVVLPAAQITALTPPTSVGVTGTVNLAQNSSSLPINISTSTTQQIIPASGGLSTYITSWDVIAGGTGTFQWVYGTGSNCATGQQTLTGPYPLTVTGGISKGDGGFTVLKVPAGNAACAITSAAIQYSGSISYQQF